MNEEKAVEALKNGDISQLDILYDIYAKKLLRTAYLIVGEYHTAEDILQDTFIQCLKTIDSLKDNSAFRPWIYKILVRNSYNAVKKGKRLMPTEKIYDEHSCTFDNYPSENSEIYQCIKQLKPKLRTALILYYYNCMSIK